MKRGIKFKLHPVVKGELLKDSKQESDMVIFLFLQNLLGAVWAEHQRQARLPAKLSEGWNTAM